MTDAKEFDTVIDASWAEGLGCDVALLHTPGCHLVTGGLALQQLRGAYLVRLGTVVLVYVHLSLRPQAERVVAGLSLEAAFSVASCALIAGTDHASVKGPARHSFVDRSGFVARSDIIDPPDVRWRELEPDD